MIPLYSDTVDRQSSPATSKAHSGAMTQSENVFHSDTGMPSRMNAMKKNAIIDRSASYTIGSSNINKG